jgi:hypothetical protein
MDELTVMTLIDEAKDFRRRLDKMVAEINALPPEKLERFRSSVAEAREKLREARRMLPLRTGRLK